MTVDAWLEALYERDYALLYRVGRVFLGSYADQEALIEDQIQETFVRAWQKRSSLQKHPNPDGWLVECFRNCLMNACKKQSRVWKHHAFSAVAENVQPIADQMYLSPDDYVRTNEHVELLRRLLGEKDAEIFLRYCVYGEKASEIAAELNISDQALRMRISRMKKKILSNRALFSCLVALCLLSLRYGGL